MLDSFLQGSADRGDIVKEDYIASFLPPHNAIVCTDAIQDEIQLCPGAADENAKIGYGHTPSIFWVRFSQQP
jgi:hypothetical protein